MEPEQKQRLYLIFIMVMVAFGVGTLSLHVLYQAAFKKSKLDLINIAQSRARIMEAVARFDKKHSADYPGGNIEATLSQFREAHKNFAGFGETGEYTLAKLENGQILFILRHRHSHTPTPKSTPLDSTFAEPMRRALKGESGSIVGLDYRGEIVLAAYEPVGVLNLGLVAKIDLSEIRAPFIKAGLMAGAGGLVVILIGTIFFLRVSEQILGRLRRANRALTAISNANSILLHSDNETLILKEMCQMIINVTGYRLAWVGYAEQDQNKSVRPMAQAGFESGYLENINISWADNELGRGPTGTAIRTQMPAVEHNISTDPKFLPWRAEAIKRGYASSIALPLIIEGKVLGIINIYAEEPNAFDLEEVDLLKELAGDLSFGIKVLREKLEHERIQTALKESEERLRNFADNTSSVIYLKDLQGKYIFINKQFEKIWTVSAKQILGKTDHELFSKETADRYVANDKQVIKSQKTFEFEETADLEDGIHSYIAVKFPFLDSNEKPYALCGISTDITERKQVEEELRRNEHILSESQRIAHLGNWVWNIAENTLKWSDETYRIFGYKPKEIDVTYETFLSSVHPDDLEFVTKSVNEALDEKKTYSIEHRIVLPDGLVRVVHELSKIHYDDSGNPIEIFGTVHDITDRKVGEEKLKIAQKQAMASQKLAGVGELAAGVSHEVLNPVNIISVHTQMLQRKTQDDPKLQQFCSKIRHEIGRVTKIMNSLLAFSREGNSKLEKGHIKEDVEKVLTLVEEEYKLDNIEIVRNWCGKPVNVLYDSDKIRQVYLNLINNAKHAMPKGGTITIGCAPTEKSGKSFHQFTFSDTGTGMSEKIRLKIFDPFFTTKPEGEGTGMGLSVVHGIIEEHGGKIRVKSEEGKGTTFVISLPLA